MFRLSWHHCYVNIYCTYWPLYTTWHLGLIIMQHIKTRLNFIDCLVSLACIGVGFKDSISAVIHSWFHFSVSFSLWSLTRLSKGLHFDHVQICFDKFEIMFMLHLRSADTSLIWWTECCLCDHDFWINSGKWFCFT